jgi:hypothetical protein
MLSHESVVNSMRCAKSRTHAKDVGRANVLSEYWPARRFGSIAMPRKVPYVAAAAGAVLVSLWTGAWWLINERIDAGPNQVSTPLPNQRPADVPGVPVTRAPGAVRPPVTESPRPGLDASSRAGPVPTPSQQGSLAIDPFADGGPAPVIVTPNERPAVPQSDEDQDRHPAMVGG